MWRGGGIRFSGRATGEVRRRSGIERSYSSQRLSRLLGSMQRENRLMRRGLGLMLAFSVAFLAVAAACGADDELIYQEQPASERADTAAEVMAEPAAPPPAPTAAPAQQESDDGAGVKVQPAPLSQKPHHSPQCPHVPGGDGRCQHGRQRRRYSPGTWVAGWSAPTVPQSTAGA